LLHLWTPAPVGASTVDGMGLVSLTALDDATVEDDFDGGVGREALPEIRIEIAILTSRG
jgi:hypothetical protein